MSRRAKVIGFDNWTGGAHLFERLVDAFSDAGLDLLLIHLGSWGNDPGRPSSEKIASLEVRDVSWYGSNGLRGILDVEQPDAVLFMSTDTFAHRAFNRYCRKRGVPTVHLYHGIVRVQAVDDGRPYEINPISQIRFVRSKVAKAIRHVWPAYIQSLWGTGAGLSEWRRFGADILRFAAGKYIERSADDARTDLCCVYVSADVDHAVRKYGFERHEVTAVGNPDLARFGVDESVLGAHLLGTAGRTDVMYIDTGLVLTGFVFASEREFLQHVISTRDELQKQGKRLVYKPHPALLRTPFRDLLDRSELEVCTNADFVSRLGQCCAAITETSSLALIPALLGLPLFLAGYGKLQGQRYGEVLTSYPRGRRLIDLRSFTSMLEEERDGLDAASTREWIAANAGPLPGEGMPSRVADVILRAIREKRGNGWP